MSFTERERDFESRYAHDQDLLFRITARRNKLLGLWAAEKLGRSGEAAEAYAQEVVKADFKSAGDGDVLEKVLADLQAAGIDQTEAEVRAKMNAFLAEAETQVRNS